MAERTLWYKHYPDYEDACSFIFNSIRKMMNFDDPVTIIWYTLKSHNKGVSEYIMSESYPDDGKIIFHLNHIYKTDKRVEDNLFKFVWCAVHEIMHFKRGFKSKDLEKFESRDIRNKLAIELDIDYRTLIQIRGWYLTGSFIHNITDIPNAILRRKIYEKAFDILERYYDFACQFENSNEACNVTIDEYMKRTLRDITHEGLDRAMNLLVSDMKGYGWNNQYKRDVKDG